MRVEYVQRFMTQRDGKTLLSGHTFLRSEDFLDDANVPYDFHVLSA